MSTMTGTWRNGQIVLDDPVHWPEGSRVCIEPVLISGDFEISGDNQANDPESIARWIAEFKAIPPLQMTPEEEVKWREARQAQSDFKIATWEERAKQLESLFP